MSLLYHHQRHRHIFVRSDMLFISSSYSSYSSCNYCQQQTRVCNSSHD